MKKTQTPLRKRAKNPLRLDPSRTGLIRQQFLADMRRRFARLQATVWQAVAKDDVLGLAERKPLTILYDPNQPRDEKGQWTDDGGFPSPAFSSREKKLDAPIAEGVRGQNPGRGFGKCDDLALEAHCKTGAEVWVGTAVEKARLKEAEEYYKRDGTIIGTEAFPHVWNMVDGKIEDHALGSKYAKTLTYYGYRVPPDVLKGMQSGPEIVRWYVNQGKDVTDNFDPDQPRDERGQWTDTGGGTATTERSTFKLPHPSEKWMEAVRKGKENRLESIARQRSTNPQEVRERVEQRMQEELSKATLCIRVYPDVLDRILDDGRFKNQLETNTSRGKLSFEVRMLVDNKVCGVSSTNPQDHPIYGYLRKDVTESTTSSGAGCYGEIKVLLKEGVKDRATFTDGDSLNAMGGNRWDPTIAATPVRSPKAESMSDFRLDWELFDVDSDYNYVEAQIHGGVKVSDIKAVHFNYGEAFDPGGEHDGLIKRLRDLGIRTVGIGTEPLERDAGGHIIRNFDPSQPRDDLGRWTDGGVSPVGFPDGGFGGYVEDEKLAEYLRANGVTQETQDQVYKLMDKHVHQYRGDYSADEEILRHWSANDEVGRALRRISRLEEEAVEAVRRDWLESAKKDVKWAEESLAAHPGSEYDEQNLQKAKDRVNEIESNLPAYDLYRRTRGAGDEEGEEGEEGGKETAVQSWTKQSEGADTQPYTGGHRITPNVHKTWGEMKAEGYHILFGFARQLGYAGESEVLVILDPKVTHNFDPNQPRDEKGQWTGGVVELLPEGSPLSRRDEEYLLKKSTDRKLNWGDVRWAAGETGGSRVVMRDGDGHIVAACSFFVNENSIELDHLGSVQKGGGRKLVSEVMKRSVKERKPIDLMAAESAVGFWDKMGFEKGEHLASGETKYRLEWRSAKRLLSSPAHNTVTTNAPPTPGKRAFEFKTDDQKLQAFNLWFKQQIDDGVLEVNRTTRPWLSKYVDSAYKKGLIRAYMDSHQPEIGKSMDFYQGSQEQFLRSSFEAPEAVSKLRLLGTRAFEELKGINATMAQQISRVLSDGMSKGLGPYDMAKTMRETITGIERKRANVLARTECLLGDAVVDNAIVTAAFRRWYEGPVVEIETASGRKLSVTPNHPMLTESGWVGAGALQKGHNLIRNCRGENSLSVNPDVENTPPTIREVFDSLATVGRPERMIGSKPDFHGDGMNGEVDIFRPDGALFVGHHASLGKPLVKQVFTPAGFSASTFCPKCGGLLSVNKQVCLCDGSFLNTQFSQSSQNHEIPVSSQTKASGDLVGGLPFQIPFGDSLGIDFRSVLVGSTTCIVAGKLGLGVIPDHTSLTKDRSEPSGVVPGSFSNFVTVEPRDIEFDQVLSVRVRSFSGHVYNLQTPFGYFTVYGLYTGNTIHAHAEGQLDAYEDLGIEEVGVEVEWLTADDDAVCQRCAEMEGEVMTIDEARGLIPLHPNCRCAFRPHLKSRLVKNRQFTRWEGRTKRVSTPVTVDTVNYDPNQARDERGRWTETGGLGRGLDFRTPSQRAEDEEKAARVRGHRVCQEILEEFGWKGPVEIGGTTDDREVGGHKFPVAGQYDPATGYISLFDSIVVAAGRGEEWARGAIAHEIQHAKWRFTKDLYDAQEKWLYSDPRDPLHADGTVKSGWEETVKKEAFAYYRLHGFFNGEGYDTLKKEDGVDAYSQMWWEAFDKPNVTLAQGVFTPIDETIAVVASARARGLMTGPRGPKQIWRELHTAINDVYARYSKLADGHPNV